LRTSAGCASLAEPLNVVLLVIQTRTWCTVAAATPRVSAAVARSVSIDYLHSGQFDLSDTT
jgi:hypothetical protein